MTSMQTSIRTYESWLTGQLGLDLQAEDLAKKHRKMQRSPFVFLRATFWRWAEIILDVCPEARAAPAVLAVGDIHLENFGTWRDQEGRLAWGVNDFDEAAKTPYVLDLVRLGASAILASGGSATEVCEPLWAGYRRGLAAPRPVILEKDHRWLRKLLMLGEQGRSDFWNEFPGLPVQPPPPRALMRALQRAMPQKDVAFTTAPRSAGTGSLGRPRFVAVADFEGGPLIREAKALLVSGWNYIHRPRMRSIQTAKLAQGRFRALDPFYTVEDDVVVRRLSPNTRKIEAADPAGTLVSREMLELMGHEIANGHANREGAQEEIQADVARRSAEWLAENAKAAARAVEADYAAYRG